MNIDSTHSYQTFFKFINSFEHHSRFATEEIIKNKITLIGVLKEISILIHDIQPDQINPQEYKDIKLALHTSIDLFNVIDMWLNRTVAHQIMNPSRD